MEQWTIDINCDLGEGLDNDSQLFPFISSCNIACGGHAGDWQSMTECIALAKEHGVSIGVHPSYPDKANFGRTILEITKTELQESIRAQLGHFNKILHKQKGKLNHIKAHGALYNQIAWNKNMAFVYLDAVEAYKKEAYLYVPYASVIAQVATDNGFKIRLEAFGDRHYKKDLSLVPRNEANAVIDDPKKVLEHIMTIVKEGNIVVEGGAKIDLRADTICVHGDTPTALKILTYLSKELPAHSIQLHK